MKNLSKQAAKRNVRQQVILYSFSFLLLITFSCANVQKNTEKKDADELVEVSIGLQNDRQVEILSGINEGERIRIKPASAEKNVAKN